MLPGFSASSSLYRTRYVYRGHGNSPAADASETPGPAGLVSPANGIPVQVPGSWCTSNTYCPPGTRCCNGVSAGGYPAASCVDLQSSPDNCGYCGNVCHTGTCCDGRCIEQKDTACGCPARSCPPGHKCCDVYDGFHDVWTCIDTTGDTQHCGSCGHRCASGEKCCDGKCCDSPCCGGQCCPTLAKCVNGKCCYPKGDIAGAAALLCLLTLGSDCNAIYQQLLTEVCP